MSFRKPVIRLIKHDMYQDRPDYGGASLIFYSMGTIYDNKIIDDTTQHRYRVNNGEWINLDRYNGIVRILEDGIVEFSHRNNEEEFTRTIEVSGIKPDYPDNIFVVGMKPINVFNVDYIDGVDPEPGDGYNSEAIFKIVKDSNPSTVDTAVLYNFTTGQQNNVQLELDNDDVFGQVYVMPRVNEEGNFRLEITRTLGDKRIYFIREFEVIKGLIDVTSTPSNIDGLNYDKSNYVSSLIQVSIPYDESISYFIENVKYSIDNGSVWNSLPDGETQFFLTLNEPTDVFIEYDVVDINYDTEEELWRKSETVVYTVDWMDSSSNIPSVVWLDPVEGENGLSEITPYILPFEDYTDIIYTENMSDGSRVDYTLTKIDNDPTYGSIMMSFPEIDVEGDYYLCVDRSSTDGESKTFKRHISIPKNLKPRVKFLDIIENGVYVGEMKPKIKITPQPNSYEDIDIVGTAVVKNGEDLENLPVIFSVDGLEDREDAFIANSSGFYELSVSVYFQNGNEGSDNISFTIDNEPPSPPRVTGVYNGDMDFSFTIMVLKENGITYNIKTTNKDTKEEITHTPNTISSGGQRYETISMTVPGNYSLTVMGTKDINGLSSETFIPQFRVLEPNESGDNDFDPGDDNGGGGPETDSGFIQGSMITLSPANPSYSKNIHINYNKGDINSNEYTLTNLDYSWDPITAHITHPTGILRYSVPFKVTEQSNTNGINASDVQMIPSELVVKQESMEIAPIDHDAPPRPELEMIINKTNVKVRVANRSSKYRYIIKQNGRVLEDGKGFNITESRDGRHKYHVMCMKDSNFTMSENEIEFFVYRPIVLLAPYIAVKPVTSVLPGTDVDVKIYFHPFGAKDEYRITGNNEPTILGPGEKRSEFIVKENCVINARSFPTNPNNDGRLDEQNYSQKYSKCCGNADYNSCGNHWSQQYNRVLDNNRLWNIEFNWYPEIQKYYTGIEHRTINNHVPIVNDTPIIVKDPKILGLDNKDNVQFSTYPHVKREFLHSYIPYLDGRPYELGVPITNDNQSQLKRHHIQVQAEVKTRDVVKRSKVTQEEFYIDTLFPPYPELMYDIDTMSCEPVLLDVVREDGVIYEATLNGEPFELGEIVWDDGDYILNVSAFKPTNKTYRSKSFYFTINTLSVIPLEPNRMKIKPLTFKDVNKARNGEIVLDRGTGHIGILWNDEILSPTILMDEKLNDFEMKLYMIKKIYHDSFDQLEDLYDRYKANRENIDLVIEKWKKLVVVMDLLKVEYEKLIEDTRELRDRINEDERLIRESNEKVINLLKTSNELLNKMNTDRLKMFNIIRVLMLNTFDILRRNVMKEAELENGMSIKMTKEDFEKWKQQKLDEYEATRRKIENAMKG